jgi:hypothetical protein
VLGRRPFTCKRERRWLLRLRGRGDELTQGAYNAQGDEVHFCSRCLACVLGLSPTAPAALAIFAAIRRALREQLGSG